jgi:hypothetical protein
VSCPLPPLDPSPPADGPPVSTPWRSRLAPLAPASALGLEHGTTLCNPLKLREAFEERAAILEELDAALPRLEGELEAARITATLFRTRGQPGASLRSALADYPVLLSQVPDRPGPVDALPISGTAKLAVLKGRRVVR